MPQLDFQAWLDARNASFFEADFTTNLGLVEIPFAVTTRTSVIIIDSVEKLRSGFDAWRRMLQQQSATHMVSTVRQVSELGEGLIAGQYETRILRGATNVCPPYMSTATLNLSRDGWKAISVGTGMYNDRWPFLFPKVDERGEELDWTGGKGPEGEKNG
ncbi:hypothetical protein [Palleronia abyssalis]|uniref:Uncharacterized protein n=1 Tax=Palleronia abyssalis TaxID=1501240 RepID=A0A2R8BX53_9RHOB|nr:hypothetical protein [Palleronia abyssalis]SPJ24729.1 hypothetical protein PAA8504_02567 [Palleronia abyssalis]